MHNLLSAFEKLKISPCTFLISGKLRVGGGLALLTAPYEYTFLKLSTESA